MGDVQEIILNLHVFQLHAEAEGVILNVTKLFTECVALCVAKASMPLACRKFITPNNKG